MKNELLSRNFETLASALGGVPKLREMILQLAVQGKLVPQDPDDEPASVLLERIKKEKEQLVKEKKIRKLKPLPPIEEDEVPYEVPSGWKWVRLGEIGDWGAGATPNRKEPSYYGGEIPWLKSGELPDGYIFDSEEKITELALSNCSLRLDKPGDVLIAMYGATIGKLGILEIEATTNQAVCGCTCYPGIFNRFLFYLLLAYRVNFTKQGAGGAQPNISKIKIINTVAPLPPLAEQKRIVAKVDELMALCDTLEAKQQKEKESNQRLNEAALHELLTVQSPEELAERWRLIAENFGLLYDDVENVNKLRQAILQLAVQGKLVPQDPDDEPASVLLERIRKEKERLVKEGKIRKGKVLPPIGEEELPFAVPSGWEWVRLGDVAIVLMGQSPPGSSYNQTGEGIPLINGPVEFGPNPFSRTLKIKYTSSPTKLCEVDDLILCVRGSTTGRINIAGYRSCIGRGVAALRAYDAQDFVNVFIHSMRQMIHDLGTGSTFPNISYNQICEILFPLPPLAEQRRIATKVDELMSLCDALEKKIERSREQSGRLLEAVVRGVVSG